MAKAARLSWSQLDDRAAWPADTDVDAIRDASAAIDASLQPAAASELALWIEFLMSRYRARPDTPAFADMDKRMWLQVLGHWPLDVMEAAVTAWCGESRPFPPAVPGELRALGEPIMVARLSLKFRAQRMLAAPELKPAGAPVNADAMRKLSHMLRSFSKPKAAPSSSALARRFAQPTAGEGEPRA